MPSSTTPGAKYDDLHRGRDLVRGQDDIVGSRNRTDGASHQLAATRAGLTDDRQPAVGSGASAGRRGSALSSVSELQYIKVYFCLCYHLMLMTLFCA